jgi:hypothetical protein
VDEARWDGEKLKNTKGLLMQFILKHLQQFGKPTCIHIFLENKKKRTPTV